MYFERIISVFFLFVVSRDEEGVWSSSPHRIFTRLSAPFCNNSFNKGMSIFRERMRMDDNVQKYEYLQQNLTTLFIVHNLVSYAALDVVSKQSGKYAKFQRPVSHECGH